MKKVSLMIVCLFAMMAASMSAKAQEITITLNPGWNWISYPNAEAMDIVTALGDFTPMSGDIINSQFGSTTYSGGRWRGGLTHFIPGWGYMYYSTRTDYAELVFAQPSSNAVATAMPTDITATSAVAGGMVMLPEGTHVFQRGVCWGTMPSPDIDGDHTTEETGIGSFSSTLVGLNPSTTYYVRAYAASDYGLTYGNEQSFTTLTGIPEVMTAEVTDITATTATCGGTIATDGGLAITARGVCWSTSPNPTLSDSHTADGTGTGSFISSLTGLSASTTYYVRAYASNSLVTIYGGEQSFTTEAGGGSGGDHAYVDLGLPSGLLWATCNVGAETPEDYGDYFAWGETQPKDFYDWSTYQHSNGGTSWPNPNLTKYCNNSSYGYNDYTDNLTTLLPEDDAATTNWGSEWRMPTVKEWDELYNNTTVTWTTQNDVNGRLFTASNGNSLFFPAADGRLGDNLIDAGSWGYYWSSSLNTDYPYMAWNFAFNSGNYGMNYLDRSWGFSVRPVRSSHQN